MQYSRALADLICTKLAEGRTLRSICRDEGMPSRQAIHSWVTDDTDGFADRYTQARRLGYEVLSDEVIDLSDQAGLDMAAVGKARLQVDSRKWLLSKALPKIYGDKLMHTDAEGSKEMTLEQLVLASIKPLEEQKRLEQKRLEQEQPEPEQPEPAVRLLRDPAKSHWSAE